jgi:hypothetical protein
MDLDMGIQFLLSSEYLTALWTLEALFGHNLSECKKDIKT